MIKNQATCTCMLKVWPEVNCVFTLEFVIRISFPTDVNQ